MMMKLQKQVCECCGAVGFKVIGENKIQCEYCDSIYIVDGDSSYAQLYGEEQQRKYEEQQEADWKATCDEAVRLRDKCHKRVTLSHFLNIIMIVLTFAMMNYSHNVICPPMLVVFFILLISRPTKIRNKVEYAWALSICKVNNL